MRRRVIGTFIFVAVILTLTAFILAFRHIDLPGEGLDRNGTGPLGLTLGLDLKGGSHLIYRAEEGTNPSSDQMEGVLKVIERRVNAMGTSEPIVQRMGDERIVVQLPGVEDIEAAKKLIGQTAQLVFKERECLVSISELLDDSTACDPEDSHLDKDLGLTGEQLVRATAGTDPTTNEPLVSLQFNSDGTDIFAKLTTRIVGDDTRRIAIFLDERELLAPVVSSPILNGVGQISGSFSLQEVRDLAIQLESGRLPVPLTLDRESTVDALLGADSLRKSVKAGALGLAMVLLFMVVYYRMAGVVAAVALLFYAVVTLATFKMWPVTLTLSGIAGFILSIGIAVDANILIFERMKEELRTGRSLSSAMETGFHRAWSSIRDSNVSTFIICGILYWFGSRLGAPLVQSFSATLFIGVAVSMFTALTVSRNLLQLLVIIGLGKKIELYTPEARRRPLEIAGGER